MSAPNELAAAVKDFTGPNDGLLILPQILWLQDESNFKVCEKGRQTGMTWTEALDNVMTASRDKRDGGKNVYYISYAKEMALEYIETCATWARAMEYFTGAINIEEGEEHYDEIEDGKTVRFTVQTFTIKFPSGQRITALSNRPRNLRGKSGSIVVIDEAAFVDDLSELLKAATALLIWGGSVRVISTHDGKDNAFAQLCDEIRAGKQPGSLHHITFAHAVECGMFQRVCDRTGKPFSEEAEARFVADIYAKYRANASEELDAIPRDSNSSVFTRSQVEGIKQSGIPVLRFAGTKDMPAAARATLLAEIKKAIDTAMLHVKKPVHAGFDVGRTNNLSSLWLLDSYDASCKLVVELANMPFDVQKAILVVTIAKLRGMAIDGRGIGLQLAEEMWQAYGDRIIRVGQPGLPWAREHMPRYVAAIGDCTTTIPDDPDIIDDTLGVRLARGIYHVPDVKTGTTWLGGERHGDSALAHAFALQARDAVNAGEMEFQTAGTRDSALYAQAASQQWTDLDQRIRSDLDFSGYM